MKQQKLTRLFEMARQEPISDSPDVRYTVMAAVRTEAQHRGPRNDSLEPWFRRIAFAAAAAIAICLLANVGLSIFSDLDLSSSVTVVSEQWLFASQ